MSKDSTQRPRPDSNRGPFDPKSDAVTDWPLRLLNVHIEFDPEMVGQGVLVCCITSLRKFILSTSLDQHVTSTDVKETDNLKNSIQLQTSKSSVVVACC